MRSRRRATAMQVDIQQPTTAQRWSWEMPCKHPIAEASQEAAVNTSQVQDSFRSRSCPPRCKGIRWCHTRDVPIQPTESERYQNPPTASGPSLCSLRADQRIMFLRLRHVTVSSWSAVQVHRAEVYVGPSMFWDRYGDSSQFSTKAPP